MPKSAQPVVSAAVFAAVFAAGLAVLGAASPALAQQGQQRFPSPFDMKGTPEEEAACAPDSARFCKRFEPDALQVLGCLQANRAKLNQACQRVLRNRGV